jgi:hypothetical protein
MIFDQAAFVHLLDEVVDGGALGLAVADRPAQVVVGLGRPPLNRKKSDKPVL